MPAKLNTASESWDDNADTSLMAVVLPAIWYRHTIQSTLSEGPDMYLSSGPTRHSGVSAYNICTVSS